MKKHISALSLSAVALLSANTALAEGGASAGNSLLPIGIALVMAIAVFGGTFAQGKALSSALESIGRNPTAKADIFTPMILGLALIESLVILAFVIAFFMVGSL